MVLYCDFDLGGFQPPEMVKSRPLVILSRNHDSLATVVPLSGTPPEKLQPFHYQIPPNVLPPSIDAKGVWWAKCDCVTTVGFHRLDLVRTKRRDQHGKGIHESRFLGEIPLKEIRLRVMRQLCMNGLTLPDS